MDDNEDPDTAENALSHTHTHTHTHTHKEREIERDKHTVRHTRTDKERQTGIQTFRQTDARAQTK